MSENLVKPQHIKWDDSDDEEDIETPEDIIQRKKDEEFLEMPIQNKKDGLFYYLLPNGNNLYRGDNNMSISSEFSNKITYFGTNKDSVEKYGKVFRIRTDRDYYLLALDNKNNIPKIYEDAGKDRRTDVQNILIKNFGYKPGQKLDTYNLIRTSDNTKTDNILSNYICEKGYDGYATYTMMTVGNGSFHKEVMICKPSGLNIVKQITGEIISFATRGDSFKTPVKMPRNEVKTSTTQYFTPGGKKSRRKITKKRKSKRKSRTYKK